MTPPQTTRGEVQGRREFIQNLYIRVCRDSGFQLLWDRAAHLAGQIGGFHALDVWTAMPSLDTMRKIAAGEHPAAKRTPTPDAKERE